jgi:hypothetical protein
MDFRLMRLGATDTCENIRARLQDNFGNKGKLKATLQPPTVVPGECPTLGGGGYTGFEHQLYRIEIADVDAALPDQPRFKWSRYGGGLVGRGRFVAGAPNTVNITANLQAIVNPLVTRSIWKPLYDTELGRWGVSGRCPATLQDGVLELGAAVFQKQFPS